MTVAEPIESLAAMTDADLLAAVANGDSVALGQLACRYGPFIHAAALRQTGDPATADDVTQAVLIVLSNKAGAIAARALPAWLHQTTRYAAANANRAAKRRRAHERAAARAEGQMEPTTDEINPLLALLDEAIARLGETDRRAIVGRFLLGQDAATVAASLGVSPRAAQKRIERAVEKLRERMTAAQRSQRSAMTSTVPMKSLAITPAVVAAVLTAAAPSPASAAVVAVPTVAAATLAKQTATWMTIAKVKAAVLAIVPAAVVAGAVGTAAVVTLTPATKPAVPPAPVAQVLPPQQTATPQPKLAPIYLFSRGMLRNGLYIVYSGVADPRPNVPQWYNAFGQPIARSNLPTGHGLIVDPGDERVPRQFAFSISFPEMTMSRGQSAATFELDAERSRPYGAFVGRLIEPTQPGLIVAKELSSFALDYLGRPEELVTATFRVSSGPWVPRLVSRPDADVRIVAQDDVVSAFLGQPFEDSGKATLWYRRAEFYSRPDARLVAIDTDGKSHDAEQEDYRYRSPQQLAAEPLLAKTFPELRMNRVRLADAISFLEAQLDLSIVVDWDALNTQSKVTRDSPVTMRQGAGPLYMLLPVFLASIERRDQLDYDVKDGVITIRPMNLEEYQRRPTAYSVPGVPLNRLDHFEVQTRNFDQWISFENLTAELGKPANLVIRTSDDPRADVQLRDGTEAGFGGRDVALANGGRVELVALGDAKTGECWRPDGTRCAIPFGYQPTTEYPAPAGKRRVWAMTVTRDSAGKTGLARTYLLNGQGTGDAAGGFSATAGTAPDGAVYQVRELLIDDTQQTVDWAVGVASKPARKVSIERGPDGWAPDVVGKLDIGNGEAAYVWGPETKTVVPRTQFAPTGRTAWKVWTPTAFGPRHGLQMDYVTQTGQSPNGSALGPADAGGFHLAVCHEKLENLHRVTMGITQFDLAAVFRNVSLWPGKRTAVGAAAEKLERLPGR